MYRCNGYAHTGFSSLCSESDTGNEASCPSRVWLGWVKKVLQLFLFLKSHAHSRVGAYYCGHTEAPLRTVLPSDLHSATLSLATNRKSSGPRNPDTVRPLLPNAKRFNPRADVHVTRPAPECPGSMRSPDNRCQNTIESID